MANEAEVIRHQMEETRESLTDKLETLENRVLDTVHGATTAVTDTVQTVKDAVSDTVESVKETVEESVDSVKKTFDVNRQMQRHPMLMLGISAGTGFLVGRLMSRVTRSATRAARVTGAVSGAVTGAVEAHRAAHEAPPRQTREPERSRSGLMDHLTGTFGQELNKLKGLALGSVMGVVRHFVEKSVPQEELKHRLTAVVDDVTRKLGGEPI